MADNTPQNGTDNIATDDIGGVKHQRVKVEYGADGSATDVSPTTPLPVYGPDVSANGQITAADVNAGVPTGAGSIAGAAPTAGSIVSLALPGGESAVIAYVGAGGLFNSTTLWFEGSVNSTTGSDGQWVVLSAQRLGMTGNTISTSATVTGLFRLNASGMSYVRVRSTGGTPSALDVLLRASKGGGPLALNGAMPTGTNHMGLVGLSSPGLAALGVQGGVTGYGAARTSIEPINVFSDAFNSGAGFDANLWVTGGTVPPTIATGAALVRPGATTVSASSSLVSAPTFAWPGVNFIGEGWLSKFENVAGAVGAAGFLNAHRFEGIATIPATWVAAYTASATTGPLLNAVGFEVGTDGFMYPVVYDNGVRTVATIVSGAANLNVGRNLFNGQSHQFLIVVRADAIYWYVDGTDVFVAVYNYSTAGFSQPDVASLPIRFHQINGTTATTGVTEHRIGAVGLGDTGRNATGISDGVYGFRKVRVTPSGELVTTDTTRIKRTTALLHSGRFTVLAAADAATVGRMWLINPVGSAVLLELRRVEFTSVPTAVTAFPSSPRITVERVTFTGAATGATLTPAVKDSTDTALVGSVRTASTGLTLTAGATAYGFSVVPILTGVGAAVPSMMEWEPNENGRLVLRAGQGIVIRQPDAGTAADTRSFNINLAWSEYTVLT